MDTFTVSKHARAPIVERVAGWSVRHRIVAVTGWLLLVAIAFAVGQHLGTSNTTSYDPGQAGQAERVLNHRACSSRPARACSSRRAARASRSAPTRAAAGDAAGRRRAARLPRAATDIRSPFTTAGLTNGRSALVTFNVAGNPDNDDQAVVPALNAVAAVQARIPG